MKNKKLIPVFCLVVGLALGVLTQAVPANAGGSGGQPPAPTLVINANYSSDYNVQVTLVRYTCKITDQTLQTRVHQWFDARKAQLDAKLRADGQPPSPSYFEISSALTKYCPRG